MVHVGATTIQHGEKRLAIMAFSLGAWANAHRGRHDLAETLRGKALPLSTELGGNYIGVDWFAAADAEMALLKGNPSVALQKAQEVVKASEPASLLLSWGIAERVWAVALRWLGASVDEAEEHLRESLRVLALGDLVLETAQTELWWGRMLRERGDGARATPHFGKALTIFESGGCEEAAGQVRSSAG
jgi:hypothetical protein